MHSNMYRMVKAIAETVRDNARDAVLEEAALLALDLAAHTNNGGDSLLDELNAQFDMDELLEQADGREELHAAVADLQSEAEQTAEGWLWPVKRKRVLAALVVGMSKRMFALADEYARIVGCAVESGYASDYATEETRAALWNCAYWNDDDPLVALLERKWAPLELVEQQASSRTVRDWRDGKLWNYAGVATVDELNAALRQLNGSEYWGWTVAALLEDEWWTDEYKARWTLLNK
jgi:hypothetical protein